MSGIGAHIDANTVSVKENARAARVSTPARVRALRFMDPYKM